MSEYSIALVGNPNCGKSTLFNALTGTRQKSGNWPGVTVEKKTGRLAIDGRDYAVVDLPGIYDLSRDEASSDQRVAREFILSGAADVYVNIVDANSLERGLFLTAQLREMGVPLVVAVNMMDRARRRGRRVDITALAERLGCPVVAISAVQHEGLQALTEVVARRAAEENQVLPPLTIERPAPLAEAIEAMASAIESEGQPWAVSPHWVATRLVGNEADAESVALTDSGLRERARATRETVEATLEEDADILLADSYYGFAHQAAQAVVEPQPASQRTGSDRLDRLALHPLLGIPLFLAAMYLMFLFTINLGDVFIALFDGIAGALFVDGLGQVLNALGSPEWLRVLLADGIGGGIQVVATFIPIIGFLYLFLSFLEDSGYMMRAAFVMDRFMRAVGLPGKAFVPLVVGFGCNVPAIMAARTLDTSRERLLTIMMAPFMSCGARLSVYALFAAAFFPQGGTNIVFALYLIGILMAFFTAVILKFTVLRGESEPLFLELPPYALPRPGHMLLHTWERLRGFIQDAGRLIIAMVVVISFLNAWGTDGSFGNEDSPDSLLSAIGKGITPVFEPMGIEEDNWPATVGIFTGILAKEVVVGTLDTMYSQLETPTGEGQGAESVDVGAQLAAAFASVPANLAGLWEAASDPLGIGALDAADSSQEAAAAYEVSTATFGAMAERFHGQVGAFAYLLFILLYFPCVSATAAIQRESNWGWSTFSALWSTGLAYLVATNFYQLAMFPQAPLFASLWLLGSVSMLVAVFAGLWWVSREPTAPSVHRDPARVLRG